MTASRSEAEREKALVIARECGAAEASKATSIPTGTIRAWLCRERVRSGAAPATTATPAARTQRRTPKLKEAQDAVTREALEKARTEAVDYVAERLKQVADRLYGAGEKALARIEEMLAKVDPKKEGDRDTAAYLRALVGAMHYGFQDAQLLAGKPTERPEIVSAEQVRSRLTDRIDELAERRQKKTADEGASRNAGAGWHPHGRNPIHRRGARLPVLG